MILKNDLGKNRNVTLLCGIKHNKKKYVIFKDAVTGNIYASENNKKELIPIVDKELKELNKELELE